MPNITQLVQKAAVAYLQLRPLTTISIASIYAGIEKDKAPLPRVVIQSDNAESEPHRGGNYICPMTVLVRSNADDTTEDDHHARAAEVFNQFYTATIAQDLSRSLDDFTAFLVIRQREGWDVQERSWVSWAEFAVTCCARDIA